MVVEIPPAVALLGAAAIALVARSRIARIALSLIPLLVLAWCWHLIRADALVRFEYLSLTLTPVRVHLATPAFATIFCLALFAGVLFAGERASRKELSGAFVYAAGALGVVFAGDWISLLIGWETMMLGSTLLIWLGGNRASGTAGLRYFGLHALGGVMMMAGIALVFAAGVRSGVADPLSVQHLLPLLGSSSVIASAGAVLVLLAILVNAGAYPLSAWVTDAYPEATSTGSVFLSAYTTKTAVFTLIVAFAGLELLVWVGLCMAMYGIVYAVLENNVRRVLAYSIVNQVGFMLVGVGIGTPLAIAGASAHAFAHIIYKALLFMTAGWVIHATGKRRLSDMGGLWRAMPLTTACCVIAGLAISAFPMTSGFTTKSIIDDAVALHASGLASLGESHGRLVVAWLLLEVASAGVFLHAGIKLPWYMFFARETRDTPRLDPPARVAFPMVLLAVLCVLPGVYPSWLYAILPHGEAAADHAAKAHTFAHTVEMLALLGCSAAAFFLMLPVLKRKNTITLDVDWFWRRFPEALKREIVTPMAGSIDDAKRAIRQNVRDWVGNRRAPSTRPLVGGSIGLSVLLVLSLLAVYLLVYLVNWRDL